MQESASPVLEKRVEFGFGCVMQGLAISFMLQVSEL